jgi:dihydrofolate reductase
MLVPMMHLSLIVAAAENGVIGRAGQLPWRQPTDLKTFRRLTLGRPIIMGRKTFQSIGRPLDGRTNIVVTRDPAFQAHGIACVSSLDEAIALARPHAVTHQNPEIMVIGGAQLYRAALPLATRIYLTRIHANPAGDAIFETPGLGWHQVTATPLPRAANDDHEATLLVLERDFQGDR